MYEAKDICMTYCRDRCLRNPLSTERRVGVHGLYDVMLIVILLVNIYYITSCNTASSSPIFDELDGTGLGGIGVCKISTHSESLANRGHVPSGESSRAISLLLLVFILCNSK